MSDNAVLYKVMLYYLWLCCFVCCDNVLSMIVFVTVVALFCVY